MILGCHVQMKAPQFLAGSAAEAISYGADAMMVYTGAPQNTVRRPISQLQVRQAAECWQKSGRQKEHIIVHAPYLINIANAGNPQVADLARTFLAEEIHRTHAIGACRLILHPGAYVSGTPGTGIQTAVKTLNELKDQDADVMVCLETMAGKGTEIGRSFEELAAILHGLHHPERFGVCLDTCHVNDAGYDVRDFTGLLAEFDRLIGLEKLQCIHLNDSKNPRGSHKDRHANLGLGTIGFDALHAIAAHPAVSHLPVILETPWVDDNPPYREEIAMLRAGKFDPHALDHFKKQA